MQNKNVNTIMRVTEIDIIIFYYLIDEKIKTVMKPGIITQSINY